MNVVIDTNVIISSIGKLSLNRPIFEALLKGKLNLFVNNEIMLEYSEILTLKTTREISKNFINLISILPNVNTANIYYNWNLITIDPDDNKFVDCYISSNANYLITEDKHFDVLASIDFPKVNVINAKDFMNLL
jgi:putative PIN family toxin of toxin-antitoxin system